MLHRGTHKRSFALRSLADGIFNRGPTPHCRLNLLQRLFLLFASYSQALFIFTPRDDTTKNSYETCIKNVNFFNIIC